jgi:hypothetical protein
MLSPALAPAASEPRNAVRWLIWPDQTGTDSRSNWARDRATAGASLADQAGAAAARHRVEQDRGGRLDQAVGPDGDHDGAEEAGDRIELGEVRFSWLRMRRRLEATGNTGPALKTRPGASVAQARGIQGAICTLIVVAAVLAREPAWIVRARQVLPVWSEQRCRRKGPLPSPGDRLEWGRRAQAGPSEGCRVPLPQA